jgi:probable addiction module antidote protein
MKKIKTEDFFESFARDLKDNPKKIKEFERAVNEAYSETGDINIILGALKVLACLKGNISKLAEQSNIDRVSVYNMFKPDGNPTFKNVAKVSHNLGVDFTLSFKQL